MRNTQLTASIHRTLWALVMLTVALSASRTDGQVVRGSTVVDRYRAAVFPMEPHAAGTSYRWGSSFPLVSPACHAVYVQGRWETVDRAARLNDPWIRRRPARAAQPNVAIMTECRPSAQPWVTSPRLYLPRKGDEWTGHAVTDAGIVRRFASSRNLESGSDPRRCIRAVLHITDCDDDLQHQRTMVAAPVAEPDPSTMVEILLDTNERDRSNPAEQVRAECNCGANADRTVEPGTEVDRVIEGTPPAEQGALDAESTAKLEAQIDEWRWMAQRLENSTEDHSVSMDEVIEQLDLLDRQLAEFVAEAADSKQTPAGTSNRVDQRTTTHRLD